MSGGPRGNNAYRGGPRGGFGKSPSNQQTSQVSVWISDDDGEMETQSGEVIFPYNRNTTK